MKERPRIFETLKELAEGTEFSNLSEHILTVLWEKFSDIQCATWMEMNEEGRERFLAWLRSGNDEDAWG
jgi:hypothetical protein